MLHTSNQTNEIDPLHTLSRNSAREAALKLFNFRLEQSRIAEEAERNKQRLIKYKQRRQAWNSVQRSKNSNVIQFNR